MTIPFLLVLATLAAIAYRQRKIAITLIIIAIIQMVMVGGGILTAPALNSLQGIPRVARPDWKSRNAIVLLGFGTVKWGQQVATATLAYPRMFEALSLYQSCKGTGAECKILVSGGDPLGNGATEAATMGQELQDAGVPSSDLILEDKSNNTFQNARNSAPLLEGFDKVYLVTSGMHIKRATLYFAHFVKNVTPAPADRTPAPLTIVPISANFIYFDFAMHEFIGIARYHVYNFMGWNPPPVS